MGEVRAWFLATFREFDAEAALERLAARSVVAGQAAQQLQLNPWKAQLAYLGNVIRELRQVRVESGRWTLLLEYPIPRRQRRIDAVVLADSTILVLEFKAFATTFDRASRWQAEDYALDLRDFHAGSHSRVVIPFLIATDASTTATPPVVGGVHCVGREGLAQRIVDVIRGCDDGGSPIDPVAWDAAAYHPTPTIVEATRRLWAGHTVRELSHAYADNLSTTVDALASAIYRAREEHLRLICFVTGVPGSGKTLAGLSAVHDPLLHTSDTHKSAFMSGNGPLVTVLREALIRNTALSNREKRDAKRRAETLIQNVHAFSEEYGVNYPTRAPAENVIIFDEAQRAWHAEKLKRRHSSLGMSEPALTLNVMARAPDNWCTIVALIGGGQEIHDGEAGLEEWGRALAASPREWHVRAPREALEGGDSVAFHRLFGGSVPPNVVLEQSEGMHLSVSVRSPRAQRITEWVNAVLALKPEAARGALKDLKGFRLGLTRDLDEARRWLRDGSRGELRQGLLATAGSLRHRAYGLEMSQDFQRTYPIADWFLGPQTDVRSSHMLEVAMSEFKCQGLELDWVGLCWGDDLTIGPGGASWVMRTFRGTKWPLCQT